MSSAPGPSEGFSFKTGDLVLVKWNDGMVYFAKIKKIDKKRRICIVVFDDKSQDEADFSQVHSVDETTTDIICIKCKRDDSDTPNEIVLCDTCGIGFHQKCHNPPIPASALKLDTPWNCMYCQRGVKCPFLTESLDVLQNLLSDEEEAAEEPKGGGREVITIESDHEVAEDLEPKPASPRKRKGKRLTESKIPKRRRLPQKVSLEKKPAVPLSAQAWKHKLASTDGGRMQASPSAGSPPRDSDVCSPASSSTPDPNPTRKRKQKQHPGSLKRQKRSSVESRTVSVTRLSVPICDDSSTSEQDPSHDSSTLSENESSIPQDGELLQGIKEEPLSPDETRPRSLRVSLSFPDEFETGSPFRKITSPPWLEGVAKSPKGTQPSMLPLWEDITTTVPTTSQESPSPVNPSNTTFTLSPTTIGATVDLPSAPMFASPSWQDSDRKIADLELETTKTVSPTKSMAPVPPQLSDVEHPAAVEPHTTSQSAVVMQPKPPPAKPRLTSPVRKPAIVSAVTTHTQPHNKQLTHTATKTLAATASVTTHSQSHSKHVATKTLAAGATVTTHSQSHSKQVIHTATKTLVHAAASVIQSDLTSEAIAPASHAVPFTATPLPQPMQQTTDKIRPASLPKRPTVAVASSTFTRDPQFTSTPEFTQATPSNVITSAPTPGQPAPKPPPTKQVPPVPMTKSAILTPGSIHSKQLPSASPAQTQIQSLVSSAMSGSIHSKQLPSASPAQTQIQSLVSSAMSTALASVVAIGSINNGERQSDIPQQKVQTSTTKLLPTSDGEDVIITGVETKNPVSQSDRTQKQTYYVPHHSHHFSPRQERQQELIQGRASDSTSMTPKKVVAKTVEIQPVTAPTKPGASTIANTLEAQGAGSIVMPIASQTPVTVVPMVVTPTVHTSQSQEGTAATYLIPALGQGGQQVYVPGNIVVPTTPQQSVQYVFRDPPPYTPPANDVTPTPPTVVQPPGSILYTQPIHASSTQVAPANQQQQQTSVVYYTTSAPAPTAHAPHAPHAKRTPVSGVNTTKPYAIVPALPTTPELSGMKEYRLPMHQQPVNNQANIQGVQYIQPISGSQGTPVIQTTTNVPVKVQKVSHHVNPPKRPPIPKSTTVGNRLSSLQNAMVHFPSSQERVAKHSEELQNITKKIGAAFANCSEEMLLSAFEDAWKKFQANGRKYEALMNLPKPHATSTGRVTAPPNVEVVSVPGTPSRLSLVRPTARPKPIAPKMIPQPPPILPPASTEVPQQEQPQYLYTYAATNTSQPQVILQPEYAIYSVGTGPKQKTYQVQTAGLFYPADPNGKQEPSAPQQVVLAQPASIQPPPPPPRHSAERIKSTVVAAPRKTRDSAPHRRTTGKLNRLCALCGKEATYLCSGCHAEWYCGRVCQLKAWDKHSEHCQD